MSSELIWFRLLKESDKGSALESSVQALAKGSAGVLVGAVSPSKFKDVPGSPFAYWISDRVRQLFVTLEPVESNGREVRIGPSTGDDTRYVRLAWEVPSTNIGREKRWVWLNKGGSASAFYFDYHLVIDWDEKRHTFRGFIGRRGRPTERPNGLEYFFKAGISWPLRTQSGFNTRVAPAGMIFSHKGPTLFASSERDLLALLALTRSRVFRLMVGLQVSFGSYEVGAIQRTVLPRRRADSWQVLADLAQRAWQLKRVSATADETSREFIVPVGLQSGVISLSESFQLWSARMQETHRAIEEIQSQIDSVSLELYDLSDGDLSIDEQDSNVLGGITGPASEAAEDESETDGPNGEADNDCDTRAVASSLIAYCLGCVYGRWDLRVATAPPTEEQSRNVFAPLPICSLGQLQNEDNLPLTESEFRQLESSGHWHYPLDVLWDGILVEEAGHGLDIVDRVRRVAEIVFKGRTEGIENESCEMLGFSALRDYFRKPSGFFADHLSRYSKSRRQAPLYLPLSTPSGRYTLWLYYPRLTAQTLHQCIADFLVPKLRNVSGEIQMLRGSAGSQSRIDELVELQDELRDMQLEIERIIKLPYVPNLNDGVLVTASPMWKLFRLSKWQRDLKSCWGKLQAGDYDWAHLAFSIWPDRIKEKCKSDRSIAIAHNLEDLCEVEQAKPKAKKSRAKQGTLINESAN
jgi:hypothetical protein